MANKVIGYHVAATAARGVIRANGLLASLPNPRWAKYGAIAQPTGIYVWDTYDRAVEWLRDFFRLVKGDTSGWNDLWSVDYSDLNSVRDPVLGGQGAHLIEAVTVPADRISLLLRFEDLATDGQLAA